MEACESAVVKPARKLKKTMENLMASNFANSTTHFCGSGGDDVDS